MAAVVLGPISRVLVAFGAMCLFAGLLVGLGEGAKAAGADAIEAIFWPALAGVLVSAVACAWLCRAEGAERCRECGAEIA